MPRWISRGYGRGYGRSFWGSRRFGGFFGIVDLLFLIAILYILIKLFLVAAPYVIALIVLLVLWEFFKP
ncbi:MAG: hypothetical protein H0Z18_04290 [Thermococcus sp.]|uniref:hypothetical protein n=1 Tax=Thermococcus sp. TaxID=35749 RepID=UPI001DF3222C|nr:hypothetical protein [Thermococcus sp.]MBO8174457.1 hypothetical protein [Thermococcus sp.]